MSPAMMCLLGLGNCQCASTHARCSNIHRRTNLICILYLYPSNYLLMTSLMIWHHNNLWSISPMWQPSKYSFRVKVALKYLLNATRRPTYGSPPFFSLMRIGSLYLGPDNVSCAYILSDCWFPTWFYTYCHRSAQDNGFYNKYWIWQHRRPSAIYGPDSFAIWRFAILKHNRGRRVTCLSFKCVIYPCPKVLDSAGKIAFQNYLNLGGNFIGIHSATDSLRNDSFYMREIGECPRSVMNTKPELD